MRDLRISRRGDAWTFIACGKPFTGTDYQRLQVETGLYKWAECPECFGDGYVTTAETERAYPYYEVETALECAECKGDGRIVVDVDAEVAA